MWSLQSDMFQECYDCKNMEVEAEEVDCFPRTLASIPIGAVRELRTCAPSRLVCLGGLSLRPLQRR